MNWEIFYNRLDVNNVESVNYKYDSKGGKKTHYDDTLPNAMTYGGFHNDYIIKDNLDIIAVLGETKQLKIHDLITKYVKNSKLISLNIKRI